MRAFIGIDPLSQDGNIDFELLTDKEIAEIEDTTVYEWLQQGRYDNWFEIPITAKNMNMLTVLLSEMEEVLK